MDVSSFRVIFPAAFGQSSSSIGSLLAPGLRRPRSVQAGTISTPDGTEATQFRKCFYICRFGRRKRRFGQFDRTADFPNEPRLLLRLVGRPVRRNEEVDFQI